MKRNKQGMWQEKVNAGKVKKLDKIFQATTQVSQNDTRIQALADKEDQAV